MEQSGIARIPLAMLDLAEELGMDREVLLRQAAISAESLKDPDTRIPELRIEELWRILIRRFPGMRIGLRMGISRAVRDWGLIGYTMASCATLGEALGRLVRYVAILNEALQYSLDLDSHRGEIVVDGAARLDALQHPVDVRMSMVLRAATELVGSDIVPMAARFRYDRPADTAEHARHFRCPLSFNQAHSGLVIRRQDLDRPITAADPTLRGYLERLADQAVERLESGGTYSEKVQRAIWGQLSGGQPNLQHIARVLGTSARTLQRRLREEKTSFAAQLDALRRQMAVSLLRDRELAVYEVAFLLGYADPSTFYRAFRRWHGISPREFRPSLS